MYSIKVRVLVFLALAWVLLLGAGPGIRGFKTGSVVSVDRDTGEISVDLGTQDNVFKGMTFAIVDEHGQQAALVTVGELYDDLFWSGKLKPEELGTIKPGYQARWILTPEVAALLQASKEGTAQAYKDFIARYPGSVFLAGLISSMPEGVLKEVNPDYYEALKDYRSEDFENIIKKYPGTGFAKAAGTELKNIEAYNAEQARIEKEREKRAAAAEEEMKRQEAIEARISQQKQNNAFQREALGKLVNNSTDPVRFVFDEPSTLPPTTVNANSSMDARQTTGSYKYKVFGAGQQQQAFSSDANAQPEQPLKEGSIDISADFWEIDYP